MRLRVYSVLDKAVQAYLPPMCFRSEGEAKRSFIDALRNEGLSFAKHRADYAFCFMGYFDDNTGTFDCAVPVVALDGATALSDEVVEGSA